MIGCCASSDDWRIGGIGTPAEIGTGETTSEINVPWRTTDEAGNAVNIVCPGDWARQAGWQIFAGMICCRAKIQIPENPQKRPIFLDLGVAGDIAEVFVNGRSAGVRPWGPHLYNITALARPGDNDLEVRVTNSIANRLDGLQRPSGLIGPVLLRWG